MHTLTPVKAVEREIFMNVLRGFAILGIFSATYKKWQPLRKKQTT
jgi:uncharacterized membrane protein YeiB